MTMSVTIREEQLPLEVDVFQQIIPGPGEPWDCYPYPVLRPTGERELKSLHAVILESGGGVATVLVDLGGRVFDGIPNSLRFDASGLRPVCADGWQWNLGRGALAPVNFRADEDGVDLYDLEAGSGLARSARVEMDGDSVTIRARSWSRWGVPAGGTIDTHEWLVGQAEPDHELTSPRAQHFYRQAQAHCRAGDFSTAAALLRDSLNYDANQVMTWWLLARVQRLLEEDTDATLLNAHYLAPLEPMLRSEAFLGQPIHEGSETHPLLKPLKNDPEALVEVACQLIAIGACQDAARWLDEAMRLRPHAMLALLYADLLLTQSRMDAEAGVWVAKAAKLGFDAPFPWRAVEADALDRLLVRFPTNACIKAWHAVCELRTS